MTREEYIAALEGLLRLFENTLAVDDETRNHNYIQMVRTLEMFIECQPMDGGAIAIHTTNVLYLDRIQKLFLKHDWAQQTQLCHEWTFVVLALAKEGTANG